MSVSETPEMWRNIFLLMRIDDTPSWHLLWHLYAMSDNALTAAQLAHRMHAPEDGVVRLMNAMGVDVAEQTGWFPMLKRECGWQIFFTRRLSPDGEWIYSVRDKFLPIFATFRANKRE